MQISHLLLQKYFNNIRIRVVKLNHIQKTMWTSIEILTTLILSYCLFIKLARPRNFFRRFCINICDISISLPRFFETLLHKSHTSSNFFGIQYTYSIEFLLVKALLNLLNNIVRCCAVVFLLISSASTNSALKMNFLFKKTSQSYLWWVWRVLHDHPVPEISTS